jgi:hypothetical protein
LLDNGAHGTGGSYRPPPTLVLDEPDGKGGGVVVSLTTPVGRNGSSVVRSFKFPLPSQRFFPV